MQCVTCCLQVNGRDKLPIPEKVEFEVKHMDLQSFWFDMRVLWITLLKVVRQSVVH